MKGQTTRPSQCLHTPSLIADEFHKVERFVQNLIKARTSQLAGFSICLNIINDHRHNTGNATVTQHRTEQADKPLTLSNLV